MMHNTLYRCILSSLFGVLQIDHVAASSTLELNTKLGKVVVMSLPILIREQKRVSANLQGAAVAL